jgi:uncharacterized Zn finger protein
VLKTTTSGAMEGGVAVNSDNMNDDQAAARAIESRFNIAALQELAGDKIFARGSDYHDNGRDTDELKWAEEGLWQCEDRPDERLVIFVADAHQRAGRLEHARSLLWQAFEREPSVGLYDRLKVATGESGLEKDKVRRRAFAMLRTQVEASGAKAPLGWRSPATLLINLTMAEGLWDEAWDLVCRYGCSERVLQDLAEQSEKTHPTEALQCHVKRVEALIGRGGQGNYGAACELIERVAGIRQGLGQASAHDAWLTELMTRHKAKRNLMKLLTGMARPARTMSGAA